MSDVFTASMMAGTLRARLNGTIRAVSGIVFSAVDRGFSPIRDLLL
jgi:hypothetical protein